MEKGKLVLRGTTNLQERFGYMFEKRKNFLKILIKFMEELDFEEDDMIYFYADESMTKLRKLKDDLFNIKNKNFDVDIFFGDKVVIIIVRTKKKKELMKKIEKFVKWKK